MSWYKRLKSPRSRAARLTDAMNYRHKENPRFRKPPKIRPLNYVFYKTYGKSVHVNGVRHKVMSRWDLAKFFEVPLSTIHKWDKNEVLPEPYMTLTRGNNLYPVYLCSQIRCLLIVMRDLVDDGYVSIPWFLLGEHIDMLHAGYQNALNNHIKRNTDKMEEPTDKFGVIYDD